MENINALIKINKGSNMGIIAIKYVIDKVKNKHLKKCLTSLSNNYKNTYKKINKIWKNYSNDSLEKINIYEKAMTWYGIEINVLNNDTDSKITELILKGINMGIIESRKIINNNKLDKNILKIIDEFTTYQEKHIEYLKDFL